jgi:hypothetical protein
MVQVVDLHVVRRGAQVGERRVLISEALHNARRVLGAIGLDEQVDIAYQPPSRIVVQAEVCRDALERYEWHAS